MLKINFSKSANMVFAVFTYILLLAIVLLPGSEISLAETLSPNDLISKFSRCIGSKKAASTRKQISRSLDGPGLTRGGVFSSFIGDARDVCIEGTNKKHLTLFRVGFGFNVREDLSGLRKHRMKILRKIFSMGFQQGFPSDPTWKPALAKNSIDSITVVFFRTIDEKTKTDEFGNEKVVEQAKIQPAYYAKMSAGNAKRLNWNNLEKVTDESFRKVFSEAWLDSKQWYYENTGKPAS